MANGESASGVRQLPRHTPLGEGVWDRLPRPGRPARRHDRHRAWGAALPSTPLAVRGRQRPDAVRIRRAEPMTMAPGLRKLVLTVHLSFSVGWIGAVIAYLVLGVSATTSKDAETVRAAWIAMELTGWSAIVPLALGSLLTGILIALGTPWGLFRYYWVLI